MALRTMIDMEELVRKANDLGAAASAPVKTSEISFVPDFRKACEMNTCGHFGKNWMCPPAVGPAEELQAKALEFSRGLVVQTVHQLQDSFDFEGMEKAGEKHEQLFRDLLGYIRSAVRYEALLPLNAGDCKFCRECTYGSGKACRFPEEAVASLEACCIDVNALLTKCGIPYNNGPDTVSYAGLFLIA